MVHPSTVAAGKLGGGEPPRSSGRRNAETRSQTSDKMTFLTKAQTFRPPARDLRIFNLPVEAVVARDSPAPRPRRGVPRRRGKSETGGHDSSGTGAACGNAGVAHRRARPHPRGHVRPSRTLSSPPSADPTRRRILTMLLEDDMAVTDVAEPFEMSLAAISKHLSHPHPVRFLIAQEKRGRVIWCKLEPRTPCARPRPGCGASASSDRPRPSDAFERFLGREGARSGARRLKVRRVATTLLRSRNTSCPQWRPHGGTGSACPRPAGASSSFSRSQSATMVSPTRAEHQRRRAANDRGRVPRE